MTGAALWYARLLARWLVLRWEIRLLVAGVVLSPLLSLATDSDMAGAVSLGMRLVLVLVLFAGVWRGREEQALREWFAGMGVDAPRLFAVNVLVRAVHLSAALGVSAFLAGVLGVTPSGQPISLVVAGSLAAGLQLAALAALLSLFLDGAGNSLAVVGVEVATLGGWLPRIGSGVAGGFERVAAGLLNPFLWDVRGPSWPATGSMMLAAAALFGASLGWLLLVRPARPRTAAGPPDAPVLSVASLKVFYPAGWLRRRLEVVHGISLTLEAGKIVGLLGPNGAGKTSTFKGILGLADSEGTMTWAGGCSGRLTVVPENDFLPQVVRARDVLRTAGAVRKDGIVREFVRILDVGNLLDTPLGRLSTGQRRRVHLLLGMLPGADVFLLDEPARSVDPLERQGVKELLRRVARRGAAVVIATHQLREFEELVDVVALIDDGRVLAHGPLPELRARHVILEAVGEGTEQGGRAVIHRRVGVAASLADQAEPELIAQGSTVVRREPTLEEVFELEVRRARENRDVDALPGRGRGLVFELGGAEPGGHGGAPGG